MDLLRRGWDRLPAWVQSDALIADTLLAALVFLLMSNSDSSDGLLIHQSDRAIGLWSFALLLPVCIRRRFPDLAPRIFILISALQLILGPVQTPADLAALILMYSALVYGRRSSNRVYIMAGSALVCAEAACKAALQTFGPDQGNVFQAILDRRPFPSPIGLLEPFVFGLVIYGLLLTLAIFLAYWSRARQHSISVMRQRNEALAFRARKEEELAASAERARVARDMHDVVAHTLSIIIVQSDAGRYATATNPDMAMWTMTTILDESRRALIELSSLFGTIGHQQDGSEVPAKTIDSDAEKTPDAGKTVDYQMMKSMIARAGRLSQVENFAHTVLGEPRPDLLDSRRTMVSYRVVQEALTNVRKHAGPRARVRVREEWDRQGLMVTVDDRTDPGNGSGPVAEPEHRGYGLKGMQERLSSIGGSLEAGPLPPSGFRVRATIPFSSDTTGLDPSPALIPTSAEQTLTAGERSQAVPTTSTPPVNPKGHLGDRPGAPIEVGGYRLNRVERLSAWMQGHYLLVDTVLALLLLMNFSLSIMDIPGSQASPSPGVPIPVRILISLSVLAPLVIRRRFPETSAILVATACALQVFFSPVLTGADICVVISIYSAMTYGKSGARRWVPIVAVAELLLLSLRIVLIGCGASSIWDFLIGGMPDKHLAMTHSTLENLTLLFAAAVPLCLIAMLTALWHRYRGSSLLLLEEQERALNQGILEGRKLAANKERERIGTSMQSDVAATLNAVIAGTDEGIALLEHAKDQGSDPDPDTVAKAFEGIGKQGRQALARMRQLLEVLHQSSRTEPGPGHRTEGPALRPANPLSVSASADDTGRQPVAGTDR